MNKKAWLALLLIGSGDIAIAQSTSTRPPSFGSSGRRNTGAPVRQIGINASVDASYDSNVFGISDTLIQQRGGNLGSKGDFEITPSLQLDILMPVGTQSVYARGQIGYDFHARYPQQNRERINLNLGANLHVLSRCSVSIDGTYNRARSNAGDIFAVSDATIIRKTNTEEQRSIGAQAQCGGIIGISPSFGYRHSEIRNSTDLYKFNDSNQDSFDASIGYQRPTLGRLSIYGSYSEGKYLNRNVLGLPNIFSGIPNDGVTNYSGGVRFERSIGSRASGSVSVGYSWADPKALFSRRFRGTSYSLNLNVIPTSRLSLDVLASRSAQLSNSVFASFAVTNVYSLNATYRLRDRLSTNFGLSYQKEDFRQTATTVDQAAFLTNDSFTRAYGGFAYDLNRRIKLHGLVSQQYRRANNALFRYNNTTVSLGASLALSR